MANTRPGQTASFDPWNDLAQRQGLLAVPLDQVLPALRVAQQEMQAMKQALLRRLDQLCQEQPAEAGIGDQGIGF